MRSGGTCLSLTGSGEKRVGEDLDFFKGRRRWRMRTYWPIMWERLKALYEAGVRGLEADVTYQPNGERWVSWTAWGPDGLPADWRELGLEEALDEVVYELMWEDDDLTRLYLYPNGCKIERRPLGERKWQVEVRGEVGEDVPPRYFSWGGPSGSAWGTWWPATPTGTATRPPGRGGSGTVLSPPSRPSWPGGRSGGSGAPWRSPWCPGFSGRPWKGGEGNS
jgi:hypothetical protein